MNSIKKFLISIPMALCWLYFMIGVVNLFFIIISIYLSVFFPNMPYIKNVLPNLIDFLNALGDADVVGLITLVIFIGSFYLAYNLYNFFKKHHDKYQPL